jgi:hypothetical protein
MCTIGPLGGCVLLAVSLPPSCDGVTAGFAQLRVLIVLLEALPNGKAGLGHERVSFCRKPSIAEGGSGPSKLILTSSTAVLLFGAPELRKVVQVRTAKRHQPRAAKAKAMCGARVKYVPDSVAGTLLPDRDRLRRMTTASSASFGFNLDRPVFMKQQLRLFPKKKDVRNFCYAQMLQNKHSFASESGSSTMTVVDYSDCRV